MVFCMPTNFLSILVGEEEYPVGLAQIKLIS